MTILHGSRFDTFFLNCAEFHHQLEATMAMLELVPGVVFADVKEEQLKIFDEERTAKLDEHGSVMKDLTSTKVLENNSRVPLILS